jgi:hypothetical protein
VVKLVSSLAHDQMILRVLGELVSARRLGVTADIRTAAELRRADRVVGDFSDGIATRIPAAATLPLRALWQDGRIVPGLA